jgi:hypothetical protein
MRGIDVSSTPRLTGDAMYDRRFGGHLLSDPRIPRHGADLPHVLSVAGQRRDVSARNAYLEKARDKVARHGHMIQYVGPDNAAGTHGFAYSVGLSQRRGYEIAIGDLPPEQSGHILNGLARRLALLWPAEGLIVDGVLGDGFALRMRLASDRSRFAVANTLYGRTPVWQALWPDSRGCFPLIVGGAPIAGSPTIF